MEKKTLARVHSTESFGTLDGPGIRYVIFLQGCPMRCLYCHNPDTWQMGGGRLMSAEDILSEYEKNRDFYSRGGITVSGGEPLLQIDFLIELFELAHSRGIHTCIDTSGVTYSETNAEYLAKLDRLMRVTSLVMLDIKHTDSECHRRLTGHGNENIIAFLYYLERKDIPLWVRRVALEGYTDEPGELFALGELIGGLKNLKALDVLPYHTLGAKKYEELGIDYPLAGVGAMSAAKAKEAREHILRGIKSVRSSHGK